MGTLYENIIALCAKKGVKPGTMCSEAGISKGLISDLKAGRRSGVSAMTAQKIAEYFGISVGQLLGEEKETPTIQMNDELKEVVETYVERPDMKVLFHSTKDLTDEELGAALAIIKFLRQKKD